MSVIVPLPQENLLSNETSPYLRQHGDNPVHWRAWSPTALAEARELDRPILLSIGYAACHWCHVMAHESFESPEVAAVMNRLFVNIKVDREERPDIDQIYMAALTAMGEQGGWPLTIFLTPDAKPFWGGTYFPKEPKYGRPGFIQVLEAIAEAWQSKREEIGKSSDALKRHVKSSLARPSMGTADPSAMLEPLAAGIFRLIDHQQGGLQGAPKFPNAPLMHTLWLNWLKIGEEQHGLAVSSSLRHMLAGGIYDHVGGGLCRYSTDAEWLVPHFEKMLYDNAQLLRMANWGHAATGEELFRIRIEETVGWLMREMVVEGGAFASSLDADSEGQEGLFYTWSQEEIEAALNDDYRLFFNYLTLSSPRGWEGKPIICQSAEQASAPAAEELSRIKRRLYETRERRVRPARDDKVLVDWNGLAIAALAEVGRSFGRKDWIDHASVAYRFILATRDTEGRLPHSILGERRLYPALSTDYAAMSNGAISLFEATGDRSYLGHARQFLEKLDEFHEDEDKAGHYLTAADSSDVPIRIRGDVDEAIPSATGQIIEATARLANALAEYAAGRAAHQQFGQAGIINACALAATPVKLVMIEDPAQPKFVPVANRLPDPRRIDIVLPVGASQNLPDLGDGTLPPTSRPAAFLCTGQTCLPAMSEAEELETVLRGRRKE